jgi:hypothetical protein
MGSPKREVKYKPKRRRYKADESIHPKTTCEAHRHPRKLRPSQGLEKGEKKKYK